MFRVAHLVVAFALVASVHHAAADEAKHKLRIATVAPDGTAWANTFHKFARQIEKETNGAVGVKFYFGGVAGTEEEVHALLEAGKLDATVSGGPLCVKVMSSMRAFGIVGLFQSQEEATHVLTEMRPTLDKEAHASGYALLATGSIGPQLMFSRAPITSMADLRKTPMWSWNLNSVFIKEAAEMKLSVVSTSLTDARKTFDAKRTDGFITTPVAALAFQWYVGTKYITDLRTGYLMGCFIMREAALDGLSAEHQVVLRKAAAKLGVKIDADNRRQDIKLLGGVYKRMGLQAVPVSAKFRAEFFDAARVARQKLGEDLVPRELLDKVNQLLADYRAEHD